MELGTPVSEADDLEGSRKGLSTGYGQSKYASEFLVREAGRRGLVGAIIRPGHIIGSASGICITDGFLVRLWKGSLQVGARPDILSRINAVPVTQVSRIVIAAVFHLPAALGQTLGIAQVTSHPRMTMNDWIGALENYGYSVPVVPYQEWCTKVTDYVSDDTKEEHALLPLFNFVTSNLPGNTVAPELDDANTVAALRLYRGDTVEQDSLLASKAVDTQTLGMYIAYLVAINFLPAPMKQGDLELPRIEGLKLEALNAGNLGGRSARP